LAVAKERLGHFGISTTQRYPTPCQHAIRAMLWAMAADTTPESI